ncbi:MAG TPA: hypothetical protein VKH64_10090 [Candidatus Binatia bacterium]|nr:hypothetical protein [Candidatus Binatia bacterium]
MEKIKVGVMGASGVELAPGEKARVEALAERLGAAVAARDCVLVSGATTGLPDLVARAARKKGALVLGVSPAQDHDEHRRLGLPLDAADAIIYTGFGFKGRNVVNVRSSDVVLIFGGATGTLNEFTIAYDEGKVIGVVEGSGGIADHIEEILSYCKRETRARLFYGRDPEKLLDECLAEFKKR